MEKKQSFFSRLMNLFSPKQQTRQDKANNSFSNSLDIRSEKCLSLEIRDAKRAAALSTNLVKYADESYLIIEASQDFYGDEEEKGFNRINLDFSIPGKKTVALYIDCYIPLTHEEIVPGTYRFREELSLMSMDGEISFFWQEKEDEDYQEEDIAITAGMLEVRKEGEVYLITGNFLTEDKMSLRLHYEGELRFHKYICSPNGKGLLEYDGQVYPFSRLLESHEGIQSDFILDRNRSSMGYWRNQVEIELQAEEEMNDIQYRILFKIGMEEGKILLPGEYKYSEHTYQTPAGTFKADIMFAQKDDEEYTVFEMKGGTLIVERSEYLTIKAEGTLEDGKPVTISYTGKPQWNDHS